MLALRKSRRAHFAMRLSFSRRPNNVYLGIASTGDAAVIHNTIFNELPDPAHDSLGSDWCGFFCLQLGAVYDRLFFDESPFYVNGRPYGSGPPARLLYTPVLDSLDFIFEIVLRHHTLQLHIKDEILELPLCSDHRDFLIPRMARLHAIALVGMEYDPADCVVASLPCVLRRSVMTMRT